MDSKNKKKGFNWLAFIFSYAYYAGYGRIPKALALAVAACIPIVFIGVPFYAGFKANTDLPVGEQPFSWPKAILLAFIGASLFSGAMSLFQFLKG